MHFRKAFTAMTLLFLSTTALFAQRFDSAGMPPLPTHTNKCPAGHIEKEEETLQVLWHKGTILSGRVHPRVHAEEWHGLVKSLINYVTAWQNGDYKELYRYTSPGFQRSVSAEEYAKKMNAKYEESPFTDLCLVRRQTMTLVKGDDDVEFIFLFIIWVNLRDEDKPERYRAMWWRYGEKGWYCESMQYEECRAFLYRAPHGNKRQVFDLQLGTL